MTGTGTDFNVTFHIPFQNGGNTHIKPEGKIILTDETNKPFEKIGKEIIKDENGSVIGEKIVDYLPLNDQGGNILPNTTREFNIDWIGFPYKSYDDKWNEIIKYRSPSEYFTLQNLPDGQVILMPWERIAERAVQKNLTAKVNIAFSGAEWKTEVIDLTKEFTIDYKEKYIAWSPYALILISTGWFFLFYFFIGKKRRKNSYPHMKYLAVKYFYTRWKDAYANSLEVIYDFRENEKPSRVAGLVENIERFIENHPNEHDLDKKLLSFFRNMTPKDENLTPKEWLLTLHNFLINHTPKRKRGRPRKYFES